MRANPLPIWLRDECAPGYDGESERAPPVAPQAASDRIAASSLPR
jgi:hypothetical protein